MKDGYAGGGGVGWGGVCLVTSSGGCDAGVPRPFGDGWSISGRLRVKYERYLEWKGEIIK